MSCGLRQNGDPRSGNWPLPDRTPPGAAEQQSPGVAARTTFGAGSATPAVDEQTLATPIDMVCRYLYRVNRRR